MIFQIVIFLSSCGAIALLTQVEPSRRFWGFLLGLVGQPAWIIVAWEAQAWGILAVVVWWTAWYIWGAVTHWRGFYR